MEEGKGPGVTSKKQSGRKIGKKRRNAGSHKEGPCDKETKHLKGDCMPSENVETDKKGLGISKVEEELKGSSSSLEEDTVDKLSPEISSGSKFKGKKLNILKPKEARTVVKEAEKKNKEEIKTDPSVRYVLFLGNLSYDVTQEAIEEHFKVVKGAIQEVRLLNDKETGRPRGCGFIQLNTKKAYEKARKLHNSVMDGRKIRVEYTTPGSGKSQSRRKFISNKSKKLLRQKAKNKKKRNKNLKGIRN